MRLTATSDKKSWLWFFLASVLCLFAAVPVIAGSYLDSAHGNATYGADRSTISGSYADYSIGNCSHCHEAHASVEGVDPAPMLGPDSHTLFAPGFNSSRTMNPYLETDNFCFYCHSDVGGPQVTNQDYSAAFGGATVGSGPQSIMTAFNQYSYHNLYDIRSFLRSDPIYSAWFINRDNPCSACHNSHLAKRNWDSSQPAFPLLSTISIPGLSNYLWGEAELMSSYLSYEAPFAFVAGREPAGIGDQNGTNTPDYVGFCTSCHNQDNTIWSTTLGRDLKRVDWDDICML
jgi:cytochrome c553